MYAVSYIKILGLLAAVAGIVFAACFIGGASATGGIGTVMSASAEIEKDKITNLMVNTEIAYDSNLSIATRNDWSRDCFVSTKGNNTQKSPKFVMFY